MNNQFMHTRRALLKQTALALGVVALSPNIVAALTGDSNIQKGASVFSHTQLDAVAHLAELIIPQTDTAGALQAGVPQCIDNLLASVFGTAHQTAFLNGIDALAGVFTSRFKKPVEKTELAAWHDFIAWLEQHSYEQNQQDQLAISYRELKELVVFSYYTSEAGATKELHYQAIPGKYDGCLPLAKVGKTWATANPF